MGRSRYKVINTSPHFVTCTVVQWVMLFNDPQIVKFLLDSLTYLQEQKRLSLYGYVIMENHLHLIADSENLSKEIGIFKSFTARNIIDFLKFEKRGFMLKQLSSYKNAHKVDRTYQVWQEGSHPEMILNDLMMKEKLEYLHNNPVRRGYVDDPAHWRYSSARNYTELEGVLSLTGVML